MGTTMSDLSGDEPSGFPKLSYDVRTIIYEIVLTRDDPLDIIVFPAVADKKRKHGSRTIAPATLLDRAHVTPTILRLNKAISSEDLPFLYARNTFAFVSPAELQAFANPRIPARALITRFCLPRMAMSRPVCRWSMLNSFMPHNVKQFTIEIDTFSGPLPGVCRSLSRSLAICLKQIRKEPVRWSYFKDVIRVRFRTIKHLQEPILTAHQTCSIESQKRLWQRLANATYLGHAAVEQCFKDLVEDSLVKDGVFSTTYDKIKPVVKRAETI
jgi:hypothetical protein